MHGYLTIFVVATIISNINCQTFQIGSYILTQTALDDAPDRYNIWIDYFENEINSQQWYDTTLQLKDNDCDGIWVTAYLSKLRNNNIYVDRDTLSVQITDYGFLSTATVFFSGQTPFRLYGEEEFAWFFCPDIDGCGSNKYLTLSASLDVTIKIIISYDDTTQTVNVSPDVVVIVNDDFRYKLPSCKDVFLWLDLDDLVHLFVKFKGPIRETLQQAIDTQLQQLTYSLTIPQTFIPYEGVMVQYQISEIVFSPGSYAKFSAIGSLSALLTDGTTWSTFDNILSYDSITKPSTEWDLQPTELGGYINCTDPTNKCGIYLLNGLRISATLFSGIMWAANQAGDLNPSYSFDVLDATLNFNASWDVPFVEIPVDNSAQIVLPYGNINSSCFDTENYYVLNTSNDNNITNNLGLETILDFSFYNLSGTVDIDITETAQILLKILSFDINGLNLVLNAPPIPLPSNIIQSLLQQMMNKSVSYINEWLIENAFQIPHEIADYLPNPEISLIHIPYKNISKTGYAQLLSVCICDKTGDLEADISHLTSIYSPCGDRVICGTAKPTQQPTFEPTSNPTTSTTTTSTETPQTNGGVWMYIFIGNTINDERQSDNICQIQNKDDITSISFLNNTGGSCMDMGALGGNLFSFTTFNYYKIIMHDNNIYDIYLQCDSNCSYCQYNTTSFGISTADLDVNHDHVIEYGVCYELEYVNIMFLSVMDMEIMETDICIGGNSDLHNDYDIIWISYIGDTTGQQCNHNVSDNYNMYNIMNIHPSIIMENYGTFNSCDYDIDFYNGSTFQYMYIKETNGSLTYEMNIDCYLETSQHSVNGSNETIIEYIMSNHTKCGEKVCNLQFNNLLYNKCQIVEGEYYSRFVFSKDLHQICGDKVKYKTVFDAYDENWLDDSQVVILLIVVAVTTAILLFVALFFCFRYREKLKNCGKNCKLKCKNKKNNYISSFLSIWGCSAGQLSQMEILETFAMCGAISVLIWQSETWRNNSPWFLFSSSSFDKLGVNMTYLDISQLHQILFDWTQFGILINQIFAILCGIVVFLRLIMVKPVNNETWTSIRISILFGYLVSQFFLWVTPSCYIDIKTSIHLNTTNLSSSYINETSQASQSMVDNANLLIGYSFIGVFLTYLSNIMLYWLNTIPTAMYVMIIAFILRLFNTYHVNDIGATIDLSDNDKMIGFISYNLPKQAKISILIRLIVCMFMFQALNSAIECIPVIILYQSFGVSFEWILIWGIWWSVPVALLIHLNYVIKKYIHCLRNPHKYFISTLQDDYKTDKIINTIQTIDNRNICKKIDDSINETEPDNIKHIAWKLTTYKQHLIINVLIYLAVFVMNIWLAIETETKYASEAFDSTFIISLIMTTFVMTLLLSFLILHKLMFKYNGVIDQNDKNTLKSTNLPQHIELQTVHVPSNSNYSMNAMNSYCDNNSFSINDDDNNNKYQHKNSVIVRKETHEWGYNCCLCYKWLNEERERKNPSKYGKRVAYRRIFLFFGSAVFGYSIINQLIVVLNISVKQQVIDLLSSSGAEIEWPQDNDGGTIFDDAFEIYNEARKWELGLKVAAFSTFVLSALFDFCKQDRIGLKYSRIFCWLSIVLVYLAMLATGIPNYLKATHIEDITPYCAPQFNRALSLVSGNIIGIICSSIFALSVLPILLSVPPSLVRATALVLQESKSTKYNYYSLNIYEMETLAHILIFATFLTPLMTFMPLLVIQQILGDHITAILLHCCWILPVFVSFGFKNIKNKSSKYIGILYKLWYLVMFGSLILIFLYQITRYGLPEYFAQRVKTVEFYMEMFSSTFLANVVLCDFIYANLYVTRHGNKWFV